MDSPQHSGDRVLVEIMGFSRQIDTNEGNGGSVSQQSHDDIVLGCKSYNLHRQKRRLMNGEFYDK